MPSFSLLASSPGSLGGGDETNSENDSIGKPLSEEILPFEKNLSFLGILYLEPGASE